MLVLTLSLRYGNIQLCFLKWLDFMDLGWHVLKQHVSMARKIGKLTLRRILKWGPSLWETVKYLIVSISHEYRKRTILPWLFSGLQYIWLRWTVSAQEVCIVHSLSLTFSTVTTEGPTPEAHSPCLLKPLTCTGDWEEAKITNSEIWKKMSETW